MPPRALRGSADRLGEVLPALLFHDAVYDPTRADNEVYDDFERQIREEYAAVPESPFRAGRRAVLESFLTRSAIYRTPELRSRRESLARANLSRAIRGLT